MLIERDLPSDTTIVVDVEDDAVVLSTEETVQEA